MSVMSSVPQILFNNNHGMYDFQIVSEHEIIASLPLTNIRSDNASDIDRALSQTVDVRGVPCEDELCTSA